jgi:predicted Zn finger-like uncharacterized protein
MAIVTLNCPHCGFSKNLDKTSIPPTGTKVTCPKCRNHFTYLESQAEAPLAPLGDLPICDPPPTDSPSLPPLPPKPTPHHVQRATIRQPPQARNVEKRKSIGFKIGILLAAVHLCLAILMFLTMMKSHSSTAGLVFILFFFLDAPLLLLLPHTVFNIFGIASPLIQYGVIGSALWFLIPWLIDKGVTQFSRNISRTLRVVIVVGAIPFILAGFYRLSFFSTKLLVQRKRPAELKKMLNSATSDYLTEKVVFEEYAPAGISSITRMSCRPGAGKEILVALPRGVVFLNESYQVQYRLNLSDRKGFKSIEPLVVDGDQNCGFLAHMFQEDIFLLNSEGKEIWKSSHIGNSGGFEGVRSGDIDGNGKKEFALYYMYREGIHLIDGGGKTRWKHPVYSLGHLEMADVRGNGKTEIIYSNSNNANGITDITILDAQGTEVSQQKFATASSEFAVIRWPNGEAQPNILLTEEGKIRLVNLQGETAMSLDAPGCKTYGAVKAITAKFKKDKPPFLVVRKSLHPDIFVLYVYDAEGMLVYQRTEVTDGGRIPTLVTVPANETGAEKLLVGGTTKDFKAQVSEYTLTR